MAPSVSFKAVTSWIKLKQFIWTGEKKKKTFSICKHLFKLNTVVRLFLWLCKTSFTFSSLPATSVLLCDRKWIGQCSWPSMQTQQKPLKALPPQVSTHQRPPSDSSYRKAEVRLLCFPSMACLIKKKNLEAFDLACHYGEAHLLMSAANKLSLPFPVSLWGGERGGGAKVDSNSMSVPRGNQFI